MMKCQRCSSHRLLQIQGKCSDCLAAREAERKAHQRNLRKMFWEKIASLDRAVIDVIVPDHGRTSCSDEERNNGLGSIRNGRNAPRCTRCLLLELLTGYEASPDDLADLEADLLVQVQTKMVG